MPHDTKLASRVRKAIAGKGNVREFSMFGGTTFMLDGKMCCGIHEERLMVRVGPERMVALAKRKGAGPMDFTGRPMRGFLFVGPEGTAGRKALQGWVDEAVGYVKTVKAKSKT